LEEGSMRNIAFLPVGLLSVIAAATALAKGPETFKGRRKADAAS
jgi:hypothetical protein